MILRGIGSTLLHYSGTKKKTHEQYSHAYIRNIFAPDVLQNLHISESAQILKVVVHDSERWKLVKTAEDGIFVK